MRPRTAARSWSSRISRRWPAPAALVWASRTRGFERWLYAAAALAPWWVVHALNLGQVAPLVATGAVLATRLTRDRRDIAAGLALSLLYLKPNTALLIPFALLV